MRTADFEVLYPGGMDSLARVYLRELDKWRPEVGRSLAMTANDFNRKPLPVVLHCYNAASNGMVSWAPRRMELNTVPDYSLPDPVPWATSLAIHEGRHAAQMQLGYRGVFKVFYYLLGEMVPGVACAYPGSMMLEGDAVIAETAFTNAGRGRQADFLLRYMYCMDKGERRSYLSWRMGSYYRPTPDIYSYGYLLLSGARTLYDAPLFMADYFDYVSRRPYDPWPLRHTLRRVSGKKFVPALNEIMDWQYANWAADTLRRGPFMTEKPVSAKHGHIVEYTSPALPSGASDDAMTSWKQKDAGRIPEISGFGTAATQNPPTASAGGVSFWIKKDSYRTPTLVALRPDGREKRLANLPSTASAPVYLVDMGAFVWSELRPDPRWEQKVRSVVVLYVPGRGRRVIRPRIAGRNGNEEGDYFFPTRVGKDSLVLLYRDIRGGERIRFVSVGESGDKCYDEWRLPDNLQCVQLACVGKKIFIAGMDGRGNGIYECRRDALVKVLPPIPFRIGNMNNFDGRRLSFESDRSGVNELYVLDTRTSRLYQLSRTKFGGNGFVLGRDLSLSYSRIGDKGSDVVHSTLMPESFVPVKWKDCCRYAIADSLSRQERRLASELSVASAAGPASAAAVSSKSSTARPASASAVSEPSAPSRYSKALHALHLHSWAPLYVNMDVLDGLSLSNITNIATPGAMLFFQNSMSTLSGYAAYKASPDVTGRWFHSGHINLTYKGLYPVIEGEFHVGERMARETFLHLGTMNYASREYASRPYLYGRLRTYVPMQWNRNAWLYGLIPSASFYMGNDTFQGRPMLSWNVELRAYAMQPTPASAVYPRWGAGMQLCFSSVHYVQSATPATFLGDRSTFVALQQTSCLSPIFFSYLYAYLPGVGWGQGLRLSALWQTQLMPDNVLKPGGTYVLPRGFADKAVSAASGVKLGADYAAPFPVGDWHIADAFLCARGVVTPHFDCSILEKGWLASAGFDLEFEFRTFLWAKVPMSIGVRYDYNFGNLIGAGRPISGSPANRHYAGLLFNIAIPN